MTIHALDSAVAPHQAFRQIADEWGTDMVSAIGIILDKEGNGKVFHVGGLKNSTIAWLLARLNYQINKELHDEEI